MKDECKLTGEIIFISPVKQVTEKLSTQEFYLSFLNGNYESKGKFLVKNKNLEKLASRDVGSKITIKFNVEGRSVEYVKDGKKKKSFFQDLVVWYIEDVKDAAEQAPPATTEEDEDDLPF